MASENARLEQTREQGAPWKKWGPYLSERQWGTVREDYSENGDAWDFFTHDHARSRAYRWGEDGLGGISDEKQRLCFALALWNGRDPILKERLFGLTNSEANHGEDVKEYYFYLDSTPTHSYMKYLYKYPQAAYPYVDLVETNRRRTREEMEYELLDTGIFRENRYFDVFVEYAKAGPEDILVKITAANRGPEAAELHVLPTLWFRNDWAPWIARPSAKPTLEEIEGPAGTRAIAATHPALGAYWLHCEGDAPLLFTENETNHTRLGLDYPNAGPYLKDGINDCVVQGRLDAVNPERVGTKAAAHYRLNVEPGRSAVVRLRLASRSPGGKGGTPALREGLRRDPGRAAAGGGRVLPLGDPALGLPGCRQRDAPGHRRHALVEAVLLLRRRLVAGGAPRPPPPSRKPPVPEPGVVPHDQRRHHLDAGQVGVPLVRGLGSRLPHAADRDRGPRLRQGADGADAPRALPPPQRPAPRL